jgi:hypothetical protein
MSSYEITTDADASPIEFIDQAPWVSGHGHVVDALGLASISLLCVHEGEAESLSVILTPDQPHVLAANGISKCMTLLFPAGTSRDRNTLAHTTKEQFGGTLSDYVQPDADVIFIKHAQQSITPAFEVSSLFKAMRKTTVRVEAGQERMGVAWDVNTGIVSVVRGEPDQSVLRFRLIDREATTN